MSRKLHVWGDKSFTIEIPDDAKVTFGPFSPPGTGGYRASGGSPVGTLRIYKGAKSTENVIAVFSGVSGFRDEALDYEETMASPSVAPKNVFAFSWGELEEDEKEELAKLIAQEMIERSIAREEKDAEPIF